MPEILQRSGRLLALVVLLVLAVAPAGCSSKLGLEGTVEERYQALARELDELREAGIVDSWGLLTHEELRSRANQLRTDFPFSRYAVEAELLIAQSYFDQERYEEARVAFERFYQSRPSHPRVALALFRQAQCYARQAPTKTMAVLYDQPIAESRDVTPVVHALKLAREVAVRYPASEWVEDARKLAAEMANVLARHELMIGRFYLKFGEWEAAAGRFRDARELYTESRYYGPASVLLGRALQDKGETDQARLLYQSVLSLPESQFPREPEVGAVRTLWARMRLETAQAESSGESYWKARARQQLDQLSAAKVEKLEKLEPENVPDATRVDPDPDRLD